MVKAIGIVSAIDLVIGKGAFAVDEKPQKFKFSCKWKVPGLTFHFAAGPLALCNISFPVSEDELTCEDLLV